MTIRFHINYHTEWGESIYICGSHPRLGGGDQEQAVEMQLTGPDYWELELKIPGKVKDFDYYFIVKAPGKAWRFEWGEPHHFTVGKEVSLYNIFDSWQDMPANKPLYSSAFTDGMMARIFRANRPTVDAGSAILRIAVPEVRPDEVLCLSGEGESLGNWDPKKALICNDHNFPIWEVSIPLAGIKLPFEYKFFVADRKSMNQGTPQIRMWETCDNRIFGIKPTSESEAIIVDGLRGVFHGADWKGAGTAVPVFSLRSEEDFGVGDFADLKKMVDWAEATGQKVIQLLPVNDTTKTGTWIDSYPYSANSAFALHPMYMRLEMAGELQNRERRDYFRRIAAELNALPQIDYERVNNAKNEYLRELYEEQGKATTALDSYKTFVKNNEYWLRPYAAWNVLRDQNGTCDNEAWGDMARYDEEKVKEFVAANAKETGYYYYVQYHLDRQLRQVRDYAHLHGVVLKGDIPIGIGRESVDAWQCRELFNMGMQAGAPPDDFSVQGQNWGLPTYNWEEMARDGFTWWKNRFRKMSDFFDAYRIDHVLGFFRIWQIPTNALHGLLGYFNPALPYSAEELRNSYDFWIDPELQCKPLIREWMLTDFFGFATDEAKSRYLESLGDGRYRLRPEVDTQVKVEKHFARLEQSDINIRLRDGLTGLIDDVLFIEDPEKRGHYHPRISAQFTYQYRCLNDYEKYCFNRLYNDFFYHRHNDFWEGKAMWKLPPLIDATRMLCCAEDLGMIPDCVPYVMNREKILSLEIQRMPKDPKVEFGETWHYPYYSVCTTSTHDMPGIRAWWEGDHDRSQRYFNHVLHEGGSAPYFAEPWICEKILRMHLDSPSMLCILPLQDWLSQDSNLRREKPQDEQINEPANPHHYWRYRVHMTMDQLLNATDFNRKLREEITNSGR